MDKQQKLSEIFIKKDLFVKSRKQNIKDHFDFIKALGKGAYGTVYKAKAKQFPHNQRAVKVITKKNVKNQKALIDQVNILKESDHPSIVKIYQTFQDQKYLCLVLDYCQGGQLFERLQKFGSFSQKDARNVFTQMTKIIKYLHSNKICHRDLKPQNFLMDRQDSLEIKLTDFGLSCKWSEDLRKELKEKGANKILGTSYYIAPQILKKDYDQKCDIWSLGVLLYILVTACPPFDGKDDQQILNNVQKQVYSLEIPQMNKISSDLKDLIKRILTSEDKRITIEEILVHPWMTGKIPEEPLKLDFSKMKQFAKFSRLKKVVVTYIASQLPEKQIHQLGKAFKQFDKNSDGLITIDELKEVLQKQQESISFLQLKELIDFIDTDKNGKINYNEFIAACLQTSYFNNQKYLRQVFNYFDINKDGHISRQQFKQILQESGITQINQRAIEDIIKGADLNQDGKIDYNEFLANMIEATK